MRWPWLRAVVRGASMAPALRSGDRVLVRRRGTYRATALVVARHPQRPDLLLVKRVAGVPGDEVYGARLGPDEYWLASDNLLAAPDDSRSFGPVPSAAIEGRVLVRYRPPIRSRRNGAAAARESNT